MAHEATARRAIAAPKKPLHDGKVVRLRDGNDWIMPPLTLREVDQYDDVFVTLNANLLKRENRQQLIRIMHTALVHNYPTLTEEEVADLIDFRNAKTLTAALFDLNGFVSDPTVKPEPAS